MATFWWSLSVTFSFFSFIIIIFIIVNIFGIFLFFYFSFCTHSDKLSHSSCIGLKIYKKIKNKNLNFTHIFSSLLFYFYFSFFFLFSSFFFYSLPDSLVYILIEKFFIVCCLCCHHFSILAKSASFFHFVSPSATNFSPSFQTFPSTLTQNINADWPSHSSVSTWFLLSILRVLLSPCTTL